MSFLESNCESWLLSFIKQLMSQGFTTQESNYSFDPSSFVSDHTEMYSSRKRARSNSYASGSGYSKRGRMYPKRSIIPRSISSRAVNDKPIVALTTQFDRTLGTDVLVAVAFDTGNYYVNGSGTAIPGASELAACYELARLVKVEFTILPAATDLSYTDQTITSGTTNIPYVYTCFDFNDNAIPTLSEIRQSSSCQIGLLNKPIRRTLYPRLEGSNGIIDLGQNQKNIFCNTGTTSSQRWNGFKVAIDMATAVWSNGQARISMKCYYQMAHPK